MKILFIYHIIINAKLIEEIIFGNITLKILANKFNN